MQRQEREEAPKRELEQKLKPKNEAACNQMVALTNLIEATGLTADTYKTDRGYDDGGSA